MFFTGDFSVIDHKSRLQVGKQHQDKEKSRKTSKQYDDTFYISLSEESSKFSKNETSDTDEDKILFKELMEKWLKPRQQQLSDIVSDDSGLCPDEDKADSASFSFDSGSNGKSKRLSSSESKPANWINRFITFYESLSEEDDERKGRKQVNLKNKYKSSEDRSLEKRHQDFPKIVPSKPKNDDNDIKKTEQIITENNEQKKQATSYGKIVELNLPKRPFKENLYKTDNLQTNTFFPKEVTENFQICRYVSKNQCPSATCKHLHLPSGIPYLWQIKMFGKWFSLTSAENEKIEKRYCDLFDTESTHVSVYLIYTMVICLFQSAYIYAHDLLFNV